MKMVRLESLQDSREGISILAQSPLVLCTRCIVIEYHLGQLLLGDPLILADIGYLHRYN